MASADSGPSRASRSRLLAQRGQGMGVEFEWRRVIGAPSISDRKICAARKAAGLSVRISACQTVLWSLVAELEQIVFAQAAERRAQQRRQIEIVFPLQHKTAQRHQIHHRDLFGQPMRSAPATGMWRSFSCRMTSLPNGSRRGSRIMMSPRRDRLVMAGQVRAADPASPAICVGDRAAPAAPPGCRVCSRIHRQ